MDSLGKRIENLRIDRLLTQQELASKLNISSPAIEKYEGDVIQPSLDIIIKLADIFNVSTDYLLSGTQNNYFDVKRAMAKYGFESETVCQLLEVAADIRKLLKAHPPINKPIETEVEMRESITPKKRKRSVVPSN